ncbi:MAG: SURF1 family protein [Actinobacteria bacterium]|nr:SURF1 family protein [Actinomycetota bacterium]
MRRLLTPKWIAGHLLAVAGVVAFVSFGFWQLDRHAQKRDIRDAVEAAAEMAPVPLAEAGEDPAYRVVWAEGVYDPSAEVLVLRSRQGSPGHAVVTPLVMDDGTAVLVYRGWVTLDEDTPPVEAALPPEGRVRVTGQLWPDAPGDVPDALPDVMKRIDPAVVSAFTDYPIREGAYLLLFDQAPPTGGDALLLPDRPEPSLGPHLSYAGQWFLFAAVVLVGYPILLRRTVQGAKRED